MTGRARVGTVFVAAFVAGCGDREVPASDFGARLFRSPKVSTSPLSLNAFSCATCHSVAPGGPAVVPGRFDPGYNLAGAVGRPSWWGGQAARLLDAINLCVERFMGGRPLAPEEDVARQLYAYLEAHSPEGVTPVLPLTVVRNVTGLPGAIGDTARGRDLYDRACRRCHGATHTGAGRLGMRPTIVPEDTRRAFPDQARAVVEEKIRHGRFFSIGGVMPLYTLEVLSDQQVADILAFLGL